MYLSGRTGCARLPPPSSFQVPRGTLPTGALAAIFISHFLPAGAAAAAAAAAAYVAPARDVVTHTRTHARVVQRTRNPQANAVHVALALFHFRSPSDPLSRYRRDGLTVVASCSFSFPPFFTYLVAPRRAPFLRPGRQIYPLDSGGGPRLRGKIFIIPEPLDSFV